MQIPIIKKLAQERSDIELKAAELALEQGLNPPSWLEGRTRGEMLTHVLAASWVQEEIIKKNIALPHALRAYAEMVRNTIS
ncbi:MAG: hypothetical protein EAZ57_05455 [Cytophagales bacterium]|nr:MAG: hypothetical protein EAZ67_06125 [Cytophagales bacterium]TAF60991.1 MAG: hypothetical protein EAZ57_05455 [Cytophagales bacterium]